MVIKVKLLRNYNVQEYYNYCKLNGLRIDLNYYNTWVIKQQEQDLLDFVKFMGPTKKVHINGYININYKFYKRIKPFDMQLATAINKLITPDVNDLELHFHQNSNQAILYCHHDDNLVNYFIIQFNDEN